MAWTKNAIFFVAVLFDHVTRHLVISSPEVAAYGGYMRCADGSSPQKDTYGKTLACKPEQSYNGCQQSYQCTTPLPGRAGVCCKSGYVGATPAPPPPPPPPPVDPATDSPPPPQPTLQPSPVPPATDEPQASLPPVPPAATDSGQLGGAGAGITPPSVTDPSSGSNVDGAPPGSNVGGATPGSAVISPTPVVSSAVTLPPEVQIVTGQTNAPPSQETTTVPSVEVITDGLGNVIVSPQSIIDDRKVTSVSPSLASPPAPDPQRQRGRQRQRQRQRPSTRA